MAQDRATPGVAECRGREHERLLSEHQHLGPRESRVQGPGDDRHPDQNAFYPRTNDRDHRDHEHEERKRDHNVDDPCDHRVDDPAEVTRDGPNQHSHHQRRVGHHQHDREVKAQRVQGAAEHITTGAVRSHQMADRRRAVDVGEVNGHVFINNSSLGIYPKLVRMRERKQRQGMSKWPAFIVALITVMRRYPLFAVRLVTDDQRLVGRTPFVFIGNNEYKTSSFRMGGRSGLDAGHLSIYTAPVKGRFELIKLFIKAFLGRIRDSDNFDHLCAPEVWVETRRRRMRIALDGEVRRLRTPLHYRVRPGALRVIVPHEPESENV